MIEFSKITNPEVKDFLSTFFQSREINREFYEKVSEDKFDYRMADTFARKSDSPRESLSHQINVQRTYMLAVKTGELKFGAHYDQNLRTKSKGELLSELMKADQELVEILNNENNLIKKIIVPWNKSGIEVMAMFWAMNSHEILHTGWNLAIMDHLGIERFPALKKMWG